jgi:Kef-type K+ transport system membrane component KefB
MTLLLVQLAVVVSTTLICGIIAHQLGQARVVGDIIGGLLLGPSLFGRIAPHASAMLFPRESLAALETLSTIGLVLFLFLVGAGLDYDHLRLQRATATRASALSIALPFLFATAVSPALHAGLDRNSVGILPFTVFLGIAMSITAFPVLARILEERALITTPLGANALLCAALDDLCAWLLLAGALTLLHTGSGRLSFVARILWLVVYLAVMLGVAAPAARRIADRYGTRPFSNELLGLTIVVVLASSAATQAIGVHPLFGAFMAGVTFPRVHHWQNALRTRLDSTVSVLLLPVFFALTGLRIRLDLLAGTSALLWAVLLLVLSVVGKMGGAVIAARWSGQAWREAFALGALLNTRGLVELIVLNIAYEAHVFSATLFTIMVLMALITTMMTSPILNRLHIPSAAELKRERPNISV